MKEQETKVEVVWEGNTECLLVKRINYPIGDEAWAITHTIGNAEIVANDWHPETNDDERFPVLTALLTGASLDALALWWIRQNPRLLAGLLSPQEKGALEWALSRANPDARFDSGRYRKPLQSILDRFREAK